MKLKMLTPEMIMTIIVALILFGVGIYAVFSVAQGLTPAAPNDATSKLSATGQLGNITDHPVGYVTNNNTGGVNGQMRYVSCPGITNAYYNTTADITVRYYCKNRTSWVTQATANGTIMSNNTYRITAGTFHGWNSSFQVTYTTPNILKVSAYLSTRNASFVANNVFNIVGIILIVGAIMLIVTIVYSYIRPGGGFGGAGLGGLGGY